MYSHDQIMKRWATRTTTHTSKYTLQQESISQKVEKTTVISQLFPLLLTESEYFAYHSGGIYNQLSEMITATVNSKHEKKIVSAEERIIKRNQQVLLTSKIFFIAQ